MAISAERMLHGEDERDEMKEGHPKRREWKVRVLAFTVAVAREPFFDIVRLP